MLMALTRYDPNGIVIAGWDGQSRGTKGMMTLAEKAGFEVWKVAYYPQLNQEVA